MRLVCDLSACCGMALALANMDLCSAAGVQAVGLAFTSDFVYDLAE